MINNLVWKEAREQLGKSLILLVAAMGCVGLGYLLGIKDLDRYHEFSMTWAAACLIALSIIAPIWIASGFTAAERRAGSFDVLLALPVRPFIVFLIKTIVGRARLHAADRDRLGCARRFLWHRP